MPNRTKIVCTLGPTTNDQDSIAKFIKMGMGVVRLNGSHNTLEWHSQTIRNVRAVDTTIPILVDLPGRKIRTSKNQKPVAFKYGDNLIFTTEQEYTGSDKVVVNYANLHLDLTAGNIILADDGTLKFEVQKIVGRDIHIIAKSNGEIKSAKGINVPFVQVSTPIVSEKDLAVLEMCKREQVDFIGISFVESKEHLDQIYSHIQNTNIKVISKIENQFAINNLHSIVENSFGILIDRGDLSAETDLFNISIKQKEIIKLANNLGKPVIVATEMLHTMIENHVPTKAEVNDITNAVLDGAAAVMMSGETAAGRFPFEACQVMSQVVQEAENYLDKNNTIFVNSYEMKSNTVPEMVAHCVCEFSHSLPITKIVCLTNTGYAAGVISRYRLKQELIVITDQLHKARAFNLFWGARPVSYNLNFTPLSSELTIQALENLYKDRIITKNDTIVVTSVNFPNPSIRTKMNSVSVHNVADLAEIFNW